MPSNSAAAYWVVGLLVALVWIFQRRRSIKHVRGPPAPSYWLGHEYALNQQEEVGDLEYKWLDEYGPTWRIRGVFGKDALQTADPKALQHIFQKSAHKYAKKQSQVHMVYLLGGPGIVWAQGEDHQRHRKIMNPAFTLVQLRSFLPLFQRTTDRLVEKWKAELANKDEAVLLINIWLSRATLAIVGKAAFDYDYGALDDKEQTGLSRAYHDIFKDTEFRLSPGTMMFRTSWDYLPWFILKRLQYLPWDPYKRMYSVSQLYAEYGKEILQERRPDLNPEKEGVAGRDVMSVLIKANASSEPRTRLDDEELMAEMFTLTLAGHETTTGTLTFLLYELARHPEYQERMREEIREARTRLTARGGTDFTTEELDTLVLCMNAIKEALRLHPIVPSLPRVALEDDVIPLAYPITSTTGEVITEIPISKGTVIQNSFHTYNRLPQVWGEDSHEFNPDRYFRLDVGKQTNVGVFANLMSFSGGPRACIGWRFALIEMQALVVGLVENFVYNLPEGSTPEKTEVQRAPSSIVLLPLVRGHPELGTALRLRVSLAQ